MKKYTKGLLLVLCLLLIFSVVALASCVDTSDNKIKVTVNLNLDGVENKTFTVEKGDDGKADFYDQLSNYIPADVDGLIFEGWFDENGAQVTSDTRWDKDGTVTAHWSLKNTNTTVQITFVANNSDANGEMAKQTVPYDVATQLNAVGFIWNNADHSDFGGWNTQADGSGESYADGETVILKGDITLYAQWKVNYTEEIWVEKFDGENYVYVKFKEATLDGYLGNSVSVQTVLRDDDYQKLGHNHYYLDVTQNTLEAELSTLSLQDGDVLVAFYSIERYTITYADDQTSVAVRYGEEYTVRTTEEDPDSDKVVVTYSTDIDGDGREYAFGRVITVKNNLTLYPVYAAVFVDAEGSGDKVVIRLSIDGLGAAKLIKNGVGYLGFVNIQSESSVTFDVTVDEVELQGKLYTNGTFLYRLEEELGVYLYADHLYPDDGVSPYFMLALDGYGVGALSTYADDGSDRMISYHVTYALTDEGDYYMEYYLPSAPSSRYKGYFQIVREQIDGAEELGLENVVGYFMLCGEEYGQHIYVENGEYDLDCALTLNGYGQGSLGYYEGDELKSQIAGTYLASENYTYEAPEYVFYPLDTAQNAFVFILISQQNPNTGDYVYFFMMRQDEEGAYHSAADVSYPELYLDGYGMASYVDSENDDVRLGTYTIEDNEGVLEVTVKFVDSLGGTMRVSIDKANHIYQPLNEFQIVDNVLIKYLGGDSVIVVPEGVTEIASDAFVIDDETRDRLNISTLTLPSTLTKIGDHAFQNSSNSGKSALKTVYINATTPPELGADPFRWVTSEFKIIVPDGCEQAYRNAETWSTLNGSATYADYVTSLAEIADKPLYEIKNGVLLSYNNNDDNPQDVAITIPDEVTEIAAHVFEGRAYITSVNLNNVTVIGASAFDGCTNLASVTFNANTVSIGDYAFYNCLGLTEIDLGNVQTIGNGAFVLCYNLTKVNIGSAITSIGQQAFALCAVIVDEDETVTEQNELIITISATVAPSMSKNIFQGSAARIYVDSYATGVSFANNETWTLYARHLRVKANETQTLYSFANMGAELVLADNALFDESRSGLYKWEGNELYIAWFDRDDFTNQLTVLIQVGELNQNTGLIRGFTDYENNPLVFVVAGTEVQYSKDSELLIVTFGDLEAIYNGRKVTIDIVNYRMQFTYNGYVYQLELANDNTFTYTRDKIQYTVTYTAENGSEVKVTYGNSVTAIGTIKNVDGKGLDITVQYLPWYLTNTDGNTYTWTAQWREDKYNVTATFSDEDNTFTYFVGEESLSAVYSLDGDYADYAVVTNYVSGKVDIELSFKTANGSLGCKCLDVQAVEGSENTYLITVAIMLNVVDAEGNTVGQRPSEFNGNYRIILNSDDNTYVLTEVE